MYPAIVAIIRIVLGRVVRSFLSSSSVQFAGVLTLLFEVLASTPQFFVLTLYVGLALGRRPRLASPAQRTLLTPRLSHPPTRRQDQLAR